jgi:uncharacterized membrane protein YedE/YeeE
LVIICSINRNIFSQFLFFAMRLADDIDMAGGVLGGVILGVSSTGFLLASGRLTGISGFVENSISPAVKLDDKLWALSYLLGLILAGMAAVGSGSDGEDRMGVVSEVRWSTLVGAVLVGLGTRMGCGCTSGHGISGLPRFSLRALVAVCSFMFTAAISSACTRLMTDAGMFPQLDKTMSLPYWPSAAVSFIVPFISFLAITLLLVLYHRYITETQIPDSADVASSQSWLHENTWQHCVIALVAGFVFGVGLVIGGMCDPLRVKQFLDFTGPDGWDPTLIGVMGGGVAFNTVTFHLLHRYEVEAVLCCDKGTKKELNKEIKLFNHTANTTITVPFVAGALVFGLGWGMSGVCPGPGVVSLGASSRVAAAYIPPLFIGMGIHEIYKSMDDLKKKLSNYDISVCQPTGKVDSDEKVNGVVPGDAAMRF